jgi:transketolase
MGAWVDRDLFINAKAIELGRHILTMTTAAGSGHPSSALALVHLVAELMYRRMRYDVADPWNPANDRLVLSLGHAVPVVYAAYADLGGVVGSDPSRPRKLTIPELTTLRELQSVLDGHPNPAEGFPFFDAATGSLGQGLSVAAGLALASRADGIDKRIYCIVGDGESREGQVWEAVDFMVDHRLTNVCAIFSCNGHGQADRVSPQQSTETIAAKLEAYGWAVAVIDGHQPAEIAKSLDQFGEKTKPLAVVARTIKGWGVNLMQSSNYHGKPVATDVLPKALAELEATAKRLGVSGGGGPISPRKPAVPVARREQRTIRLPSFDEALHRSGMEAALNKKMLATRAAYGAALVALGDADVRVVSLDGDVSNSTFADRFAKHHPNRFYECKIAEQNMISVAAGLSAAGKIPFASSFAKFIARAVDQIDMAAISRANVKIVGSHAGVSLAADGPSQMAVSDVAYFRSMTHVQGEPGAPACRLFHPSDAVSAYRLMEHMANVHGLCYLRTHRPDAPFLYPFSESFPLSGCKRLREGSQLTLASSGYMVHTALRAADELARQGVSISVFDAYMFPLDARPILEWAQNHGGVILVVEDNYAGGLHAELAEAAAETGGVRVVGLTPRRFPKSAKSADEVFDYVGIGWKDIMGKAIELTGE